MFHAEDEDDEVEGEPSDERGVAQAAEASVDNTTADGPEDGDEKASD